MTTNIYGKEIPDLPQIESVLSSAGEEFALMKPMTPEQRVLFQMRFGQGRAK